MSSFSRTLPRVLRPVSAPSRSLHVSARQLDNRPPPVHRAVLIDMDRVPGQIREDFHMQGSMKTAWYAVGLLTLASFAYINLMPHDWAGNLGYTSKEVEQKKKDKAKEEEDEH